MTVPGQPPLHGQPIGGIANLARMTAAIAEQVHGVSSMSVGPSMHAIGGGNSVSLSPKLYPSLQQFCVLGAWRRHKTAGYPGATKGLNWVCDAVPVGYWEAVTQATEECPVEESSYWKEMELGEFDIATEIWWNIEGPPYGPSEDTVATLDPCDTPATLSSQANLPPPCEVGQWVWCIYRYDSGTWHVLTSVATAAPSTITRFILRTDLYPAPQAGYSIAEKLVWRESTFKCSQDYYGTGPNLWRICYSYPKRLLYYVFDWAGEFSGVAHLGGGESQRRNDTPTLEQLCFVVPTEEELQAIIDATGGGEWEWSDEPEEITRMTCANFVYMPGQQVNPCAEPEEE